MSLHPLKARNTPTENVLTVTALVCGVLTVLPDFIGSRGLYFVCKPLTMIALIALAALRPPQFALDYKHLILASLGFSFVGDVALMFQGGFLYGLSAFFIAHLFFVAAFSLRSSRIRFSWPVALLVLYGGAVVWLISPHLGAMKWPVFAYMAVLFSMAFQAFNRLYNARLPGAGAAAVGAGLFVISDSMLSINRFYHEFDLATLVVLGTYFTAQYFFVRSI